MSEDAHTTEEFLNMINPEYKHWPAQPSTPIQVEDLSPETDLAKFRVKHAVFLARISKMVNLIPENVRHLILADYRFSRRLDDAIDHDGDETLVALSETISIINQEIKEAQQLLSGSRIE